MNDETLQTAAAQASLAQLRVTWTVRQSPLPPSEPAGGLHPCTAMRTQIASQLTSQQ